MSQTQSSGTVRILVADDHALVRKGLIQLLARQRDFGEFGEAATAAEALALAERQPWDIVLLDLALPDGSGLEVLQRLRELRPALPVLVVSMYPEDQLGERLLESGAAGYLTKEAAPEELVRAIRRVLRGQKYLSPALEAQLAGRAPGAPALPHDRLSAREFEVMLLLATGRPIHVIARRLGVSPKTVTTYRARVLAKMRMTSNAELTFYAVQKRLIADSAFRLAM
jgi:two-component system invasion response regulator UvrY